MKIEDYNKYYIQGSDHYLIPKDEFMELFNEMVNWKEENKRLKANWNKLKKCLRIKDILANSKINPQSIKFKDLLKHMEYLEKER